MTDPQASSGPATGLLRDEAFAPELTTAETVFAGRIWAIRRESFRYGDGELTREFMAHPGAAAVVALDAEGRVLLIQQYRHPIRQRDWELPAGLLDVPGEDPLEAAKRELAEEADLVAEHWEPLLSVVPTPGGSDEVIHLFLAKDLRPTADTFVREGEEADLRLEWLALSDAADAVLSGRMRNGILVAGVLAATMRGAERGA